MVYALSYNAVARKKWRPIAILNFVGIHSGCQNYFGKRISAHTPKLVKITQTVTELLRYKEFQFDAAIS